MPAAFPQTSRLILDAFRELELRERSQNPNRRPAVVRQVARQSQISPASLVAWRAGKNAPTQKNAEVLARHLFPQDPARQDEFVEAIAKERGSVRPTPASPPLGPLERLEGNKQVEIKVVDLPPFAFGRRGGFFDKFVTRFIDFASIGGLKMQPVPFHEVTAQILSDRPSAAVAGLLATVDRMRTFEFITTPIRIRVAAVIRRPRAGEPSVERICAALKRGAAQGETVVEIDGPGGRKRRIPVRALIARGEVGGLFAEKALALRQPQIRYIDRGDLDKYRLHLEAHDPGAVSVALLDEYSAGLLITKARRDGGSARSNLMFAFDPIDTSIDENPLPSYFLSVGADRKHGNWCRYLAESIEAYVEADVSYVLKLYQDLWDALNTHHDAVLEACGASPKDRALTAALWTHRVMGVPTEQKTGVPSVHRSHAWSLVLGMMGDG